MTSWKQAFLELLDEAYTGPENPRATWFVSNEPKSGILGTLESVSAEAASTPPFPDGATIAGHTEHLRWSLSFARVYLEGNTPALDWEDSWKVSTVSPEEWDHLRQSLRSEFDHVRDLLIHREDWSDPFLLKGALAMLPHAAYHLGALRVLVQVISSP